MRKLALLLCLGLFVHVEFTVADEATSVNDAASKISINRASVVEPANFVMHSIEAKDIVDQQRQFVQLRGPALASAIMTDQPAGHLVWYKIGNPKSRRPTDHVLRVARGEPVTVTVGEPQYWIAPAQQVTDGSPPEVPESIGYFKVFKLSEDSVAPLAAAVARASEIDGIDRTLPTHVAFPSEYWHHEDYTAVADEKMALIICGGGLTKTAVDRSVDLTVLDSFGINQLAVTGEGPQVVVAAIE